MDRLQRTGWLVAVVLLLAGCGTLPNVEPQDLELLEPRTTGITVRPSDPGTVDLAGGPYRIAWVTEGCTLFQVSWMQVEGLVTRMPVFIDPSGELLIDLPTGPGSLERAADCDYTIRFEEAPP